jgi:hypothetical protein
MYYSIPLPVALDMVYAITILGRWAKLATPGTVRYTAVAVPPDPSGSYNNPNDDKGTSGLSNPNISMPPMQASKLLNAIKTLKVQLATQPGLQLDVTGLMGTLSDRLNEASASLTAQDTDPHARKNNIWSQSAIKLRIAQLRVEQWIRILQHDDNNEEMDQGSPLAEGVLGPNDSHVPNIGQSSTHTLPWPADWMTIGAPLNGVFLPDFEDISPFPDNMDWVLNLMEHTGSMF